MQFLDLPQRTIQPRRAGITHVFDKGTPLADIQSRLDSDGPYLDVWKYGFGTSYLDPQIAAKNSLLRDYGVKVCPGGTLLEAAWTQQRTDSFFEWAAAKGFDCVEVSRGATLMPAATKHGLVSQAVDHGFEVFAEVGNKDPACPGTPDEWAIEAHADADAGADWIVAEGRESGNVGLYSDDGSVCSAIFAELETLADTVAVIFEAPRRSQQAWLISRLGPNVNLGNIAPAEVLGVEALRVGLRADTIATPVV